ncbi:Mediator complex subunit 13 C-terminal [Musa troglodytarum]|uniref:Mediator of RNA polymerase II transcription subunit 13 n=1 Tax=Musa troglodytarum TaxID=320322 RepID=A0A9E7GTF7_9LILI|nr:Mediator complex subunit 13 C-terminal [Musa troglodytarum]
MSIEPFTLKIYRSGTPTRAPCLFPVSTACGPSRCRRRAQAPPLCCPSGDEAALSPSSSPRACSKRIPQTLILDLSPGRQRLRHDVGGLSFRRTSQLTDLPDPPLQACPIPLQGELQAVSWFQFFPCETDSNSLSEKRLKAEQKDAATHLVLSAHLQLQNEGFLSTWTNSFVGPWDPSQGAHNPDEKIKLWLFLPGRHSSVVETAHAAISRLRVVGSGLWLAPGDSEEVGVALAQALRNSLERSLRELSYVRFGDVFTRCHPLTSNVRRPQPTIEFTFAATEEAIYVHAVVSAKHIRGLCSSDMEKLLWHCSSHSIRDGIPAIVAPTGMRGRLTGCCPSDLVKQVYSSKLKGSNGIAIGMPSHVVQSSNCQLRGQRCYVEVTFDCHSDIVMGSNNKQNTNESHVHNEEPHLIAVGKVQKKHGVDHLPVLERTFIYPAEAVVIPMMHRAFARSFNKSLWLQNWVGTSLSEMWPLWNFSDSSQPELCLALGDAFISDPFSGLGVEFNGMRLQKQYISSSNSISSSISSISRTSSESEHATAVGAGDLEADADSLTCRQSGLSSNDQFENDGPRKVTKRPRTGATDTCVQTGTVLSATIQDAFMSDYSIAEVDNSGAAGAQNAQVGSHWDWDGDDRGIGMDIQTLLSEFGGFGDFFEDDILAFGEFSFLFFSLSWKMDLHLGCLKEQATELDFCFSVISLCTLEEFAPLSFGPPGTAESQALIFPAAEFGDVTGSPCNGVMEVSEQNICHAGLASLEGFNHQTGIHTEETTETKTDIPKDTRLSSHAESGHSTGKFDYLTKAEAMMTFAPEYAPVETPNSEFSTSIFRSPYVPRSKMVESSSSSSSAYMYNAMPPPCMESSEEKSDKPTKLTLCELGYEGISSVKSSKLYTYVACGIEKKNNRSVNNDVTSSNGEGLSSICGVKSMNAALTLQKKSEHMVESAGFLMPVKTVLATDIECMMYQTAMCKVRHTLLSLRNKVSMGLRNAMSDLVQSDSSVKSDIMTVKHELRKKDSIPVRLAGDIDGGMQDGTFTTPVGVWRSVGAPKATKPTRVCENLPSMPLNNLSDEGINFHGQRQPLQDLLDAIVFLVQQSTSFVDFSLDTNDGYGAYYWLGIQEQRRREFACGPSMIHAGCGGLISTCHSLDIAGVDLIDPLSADVQASSVMSLLQSDIKVALKSAFGNLDGPLSVIDWCRGCSHFVDSGTPGDGNEPRDSSAFSLVGEPISPSQSTGGSSSTRDRARIDESSQQRLNQEACNLEAEQQKGFSRFRPTIMVLPLPAILVGYQDDWLKTSVNSLRLWEKAPLEPYASPKPVTYYALCPDIELLTSAAVDFFQQLGTVYEICKLGSHTPHFSGGQMELPTGACMSSGLILVDCPQQVKVVYVVCPFPEPKAILQTLVECSSALGSVVLSQDKERRSLLYSQVAKALNCTAAVDEASASNVLMLSGFSVPKFVLQIITVETLLRIYRPSSELAILKDIAFTVYNKARRIPRAVSSSDMFQNSSFSGRSQSGLMHMTSSIPGLSKDCLVPRMSGPSLSREGEIDTALRPSPWDSSWQTSRIGGLSCEQNRSADLCGLDDARFMFEPLFILAEPGSLEHGSSPIVFGSSVLESSSLKFVDDTGGIYMQSSTSGGATEIGTASLVDGSEHDNKAPSLHCTYGWTEDWRWLICIWTDSRGELLDSCIFPFGGISSRQDTKVLQTIFLQILQQGCQISASCSDAGLVRPRDMIITRFGCFFELECQEWQNAIYSFGGNDIKKWPLQLRRSTPDGVTSSNNGSSLQQHDLVMIQERNLPSSPSPSLYSPHSKSSFTKSGMGQPNSKKQILVGQTGVDSSRSSLQLVQSISLVGVSIDHSLQLILQADMSSSEQLALSRMVRVLIIVDRVSQTGIKIGGSTFEVLALDPALPFVGGMSIAHPAEAPLSLEAYCKGGTQSSSSSSVTSYVEGFSPLKSLGSMQASYLLIPSPNMRCLPPLPLHLPTCLTSESPPLAHLLHSKGSAIPLATGYIVSKTVPPMRQDLGEPTREDWPSVLSVSLIDHYGGNNSNIQERMIRGVGSSNAVKQVRNVNPELVNKDYELETHIVLESIAAELHSLSWMTVSPVFLERRTALPVHCDMLLRLRRLLHYADKELIRPPENMLQV